MVPSSAAGKDVPPEYIQEVLDLCVRHQFQEMKKESTKSYREEHSSINRTMLAMALLSPGVLKRQNADPMV